MLKDLLTRYDKETGFHSLAGPMRANPTFQEIVAQGEKALPAVLEYLRDNAGGMSIVLILSEITQEQPLPPEPVAPGFVGYDVPATREAWLTWGREKGHLPA